MIQESSTSAADKTSTFDNKITDVIEDGSLNNNNNYDNNIPQQNNIINSLHHRQNLAVRKELMDAISEAPPSDKLLQTGDHMGQKEDGTGDVAIVLDESQDEAVAKHLATVLEIRKPGLIARVHSLTRCQAVLVSATTKALLQWAEDFRLVKRERDSGYLRTFILSQFEQFELSETPDDFFTRAERQRLVHLAAESVRAVVDVETFGTKQILHGQPILAHLALGGVVRQFFPLHSQEELKKLRKRWVGSPVKIKQPLDEIASYFDCSLGFYFAWLEFYTRWLFLPAIFGLLVSFLAPTFLTRNDSDNIIENATASQNEWSPKENVEQTTVDNSDSSQVPNSTVFISLILFNTVWFAFYRKCWTRKSNELAFRWGAIDHRDTSDKYFLEARPLFTGMATVNPVTGKATLYWPAWRRSLVFYLVSVPVSAVCLLFMMMSSVFCLRLQKYADRFAPSWPTPVDTIISLTPLILFVLSLNFWNNVYMTVAIRLNDLENHFSQSDYVTQLQAKLILFRFLNGFLPLFYTAFYDKDFKGLQEQVAALVMIRQVASNAVEVLLPYLLARYQQFSLHKAKPTQTTAQLLSVTANNLEPFLLVRRNRRANSVAPLTSFSEALKNPKQLLLNQVENEALMPEFDDCFEDYLEMFCQLGYIMMFSVAFPPVAFWCLLNNFVEIKTDALKMCNVCRRPFARERVRDIGIWTGAFEMLAICAVVVNVALVANFDVVNEFCSPTTVNKPYVALIGVIVCEHAIFALRAFINQSVTDVPGWINIELAKREYAQLTASDSSELRQNSKDE